MVSLELVSFVSAGSFEVLVLVPTFGVMAVKAASNQSDYQYSNSQQF